MSYQTPELKIITLKDPSTMWLLPRKDSETVVYVFIMVRWGFLLRHRGPFKAPAPLRNFERIFMKNIEEKNIQQDAFRFSKTSIKSLLKVMYQKSMKGVIGSYFKFKELYPWPKHSSNISIKKVIGNGLENLKVESKWANLHVFCTFEVILWPKRTKNM